VRHDQILLNYFFENGAIASMCAQRFVRGRPLSLIRHRSGKLLASNFFTGQVLARQSAYDGRDIARPPYC
jgi:hypothetical protein